MAESDYVNLIAQGLKAYHDAGYMAEFDANVGKVYEGDFSYSQFYSMMAYNGLQNTNAYNRNIQNAEWYNMYDKYRKAASMCDVSNCK